MIRSLRQYRYPAVLHPILGTPGTGPLSLLKNYKLLPIEGNSGEAPQKKQYLLDCCAFLEDVAIQLALHSFCKKAIWVLPGGRAVAGDASAHYWQYDPCRGLRVSILAGFDESYADRDDGVSIMVRTLTLEDPEGKASATYWLTANASSQHIAQALVEIANGHVHRILTANDILHPNPVHDLILQIC